MDRFTGGCLCGDVRIVASGRPDRVGLCRCLDCRKHHGALFHASAIVPENAVTIEGETSDYAGRSFCPRCCSCRPRCSPVRSIPAKSRMGASTTHSCCSGQSGHGMQGRPLQRSLSDDLLLVLCI